MSSRKVKDEVELAFESLEQVFARYKDHKAHESNRHPAGSPSRVEADLTELEKAHLQLLQSKLHAAIANRHISALRDGSASADRLGKKVFWLNVVLAILSAVVATAAILELSQ